MTVSTHTYSAYVVGTPNLPLSVRGGSITLDESAAPHVTARLDIAVPNTQTLAALDSRLSPPPRVRVTATQTVQGTQGITRLFDLTLRDREVNHASAVVTLTLSSDEALLDDYAPLSDDGTAYTNQTSVRAIVNAVLAKVIPGASLAASPSVDASVAAYANATNLSPNGGFRQTINGWTTGAPSFAVVAGGPGVDGITTYARATFNGGGGGWFNIGGRQAPPTEVPIRTGQMYRSSAWVWCSVAVSMAAYIEWGDGNVNFVSSSAGPTVSIPANTWRKLTITAPAPVNATRAGSYFYRTTGTWPAGAELRIAGHRFSEAPAEFDQFEFFDGESTDTAHHAYAWTGATNASPSTRVAVSGRSFDMLRWKAGRSALSFLMPIVQVCGLRLVCNENRVWTLRPEGYTAADSLSIRHGVNLIDGTDKVSRDDQTWFDAAVTEHAWTAEDGTQQHAVDAYALSASYTRLRTFEKNTPYPGPGFSAYVVRRAQGRGRAVSATCVTDWRARAEQPISIVLEGAPIQTGQTSRVDFDLDRDEMTVSTRTTDTPATAWILLPTGHRWIDSPVGGSWTGEAA